MLGSKVKRATARALAVKKENERVDKQVNQAALLLSSLFGLDESSVDG